MSFSMNTAISIDEHFSMFEDDFVVDNFAFCIRFATNECADCFWDRFLLLQRVSRGRGQGSESNLLTCCDV